MSEQRRNSPEISQLQAEELAIMLDSFKPHLHDKTSFGLNESGEDAQIVRYEGTVGRKPASGTVNIFEGAEDDSVKSWSLYVSTGIDLHDGSLAQIGKTYSVEKDINNPDQEYHPTAQTVVSFRTADKRWAQNSISVTSASLLEQQMDLLTNGAISLSQFKETLSQADEPMQGEDGKESIAMDNDAFNEAVTIINAINQELELNQTSKDLSQAASLYATLENWSQQQSGQEQTDRTQIEKTFTEVGNERLQNALNSIDNRTRQILVLRFGLESGEPMALQAIADYYGGVVTKERIYQYVNVGCKKVAAALFEER
jgi:hypothetical protein